MPEQYSNYLRPIFTENLLKTLQKGNSINLIATDGQGRRRLLEDIRKSNLKNTKIFFVDMNEYRENYQGFVASLWLQVDEKEKEPFTDLERIFELLEQKEYRVIIILHHFDELLDNSLIDKLFAINFFNQLNALCQRKQISLLCVTSQPHDQSLVFINEKPICYSWLELEKKRLPKLTHDEIKFELKCRKLPLSNSELSEVTWAIHGHEKPYRLLNFFAGKIANQENTELTLPTRLKIWSEQFNEDDHNYIKKYLAKIHHKTPTWETLVVMRIQSLFLSWIGFCKSWLTYLIYNNHKK
jgi:archaellum biogenesis ATPase FlaH